MLGLQSKITPWIRSRFGTSFRSSREKKALDALIDQSIRPPKTETEFMNVASGTRNRRRLGAIGDKDSDAEGLDVEVYRRLCNHCWNSDRYNYVTSA